MSDQPAMTLKQLEDMREWALIYGSKRESQLLTEAVRCHKRIAALETEINFCSGSCRTERRPSGSGR